MIRTLALAFCKCLESIIDSTPPPLSQLHLAHAFAHVGEYVWILHALTLSTLVAPFDKTTKVLYRFHLLVKVDFPFLLMVSILRHRLH